MSEADIDSMIAELRDREQKALDSVKAGIGRLRLSLAVGNGAGLLAMSSAMLAPDGASRSYLLLWPAWAFLLGLLCAATIPAWEASRMGHQATSLGAARQALKQARRGVIERGPAAQAAVSALKAAMATDRFAGFFTLTITLVAMLLFVVGTVTPLGIATWAILFPR